MTELMVIFVIGLLVLGPKRLPSLARSLGRSLAEFRRASTDLRREFLDVADNARFDLNDIGTDQTPGAPGNENADSTPGPTAAQTAVEGGAARAGGGATPGSASLNSDPPLPEEPEAGHEDAGADDAEPTPPAGRRESSGE